MYVSYTYITSISTFVYVNIQNFICEYNIYSFISLPLFVAMRQSCFQNELLFDLNDVLTNHFYSGIKLAKIENLEHRERERELLCSAMATEGSGRVMTHHSHRMLI